MAAKGLSSLISPTNPDSKSNPLLGRFMLSDLSEYSCRVIDISVDGGVFLSEKIPQKGESAVAYLEEIGRVEFVVEHIVKGGFEVSFQLQGARRDKFKQKIGWLTAQPGDTLGPRRHTRYEPTDTKSQIVLADGRVYDCEVLDISLSGAGIKMAVLPALGTVVTLGKMHGRVVRYLKDGIGVEFIKPLDQQQLKEQVR